MSIQLFNQPEIISIIRGYRTETALSVVDALYEGGIRTFEITMDSPDASHIINRLSRSDYLDLRVGAGTVLSIEEAEKAIDAGAEFIFSPHFDEGLVKRVKELGCISIPGTLTPSEMVKAIQAGADFVKVFPANSVGPAYLKAIQTPIPHLKMIPTGGITKDNMVEYLKNGAVAVGLGGSLVRDVDVRLQRYDLVKQNAEDVMTILNDWKRENLHEEKLTNK
ncbi:2-dehydro-3-deoxyphosphogluconate aldolase/(4S)-4-hydroxy-2-oxoglutarate aldolase [Bacillus pakistanensis]|uniref:2-dehydro-3-deoxyphosphogluconate aldolase/(4S)-4-hydroxy-2-oxoglutarate aldolase n=1 Tax=Rossellomorea pakistanensis TaxID=992288 RepID=A0ABS2NHK8_9BACI|nr:bifunctional 4-hydroxy-2-oxoglutarate aldolase/2-dehydro-3-deoxy-phosphogluconate aldolase [Bacillus pakistanensis]MBM7587290.1 2-dehydro-3-deoxyphosphogluconate aldolase/(4S)-4-hydroxy-2-oxoglutarate aldolase [Bacillus pakistanensis]